MTLQSKATNRARILFNDFYREIESETQDLLTGTNINNLTVECAIMSVNTTLNVLNELFEDGVEVKSEIRYWTLVKESLSKMVRYAY